MDSRKIVKIVLGLLFILYFIFRIPVPNIIASTLVTAPGKIIATLFVLYLFLHSHPVLAILGLLVAADLIRRSSPEYIRYQQVAKHDYSAFNPFPYTLEQEIVKLRAPIYDYASDNNNTYSFTSTLDDQKNAASVNYNGII
jgi:hypothetical protein